MEKLKIYISTHKVFDPIYNDPIYEVVAQPQVDADDMRSRTNLLVHHMNVDHIFYNFPRGFSDVANIHWVWKHCPETEYIGFAQFGAGLDIDSPVNIDWVENVLSDHDAICMSYDLDTSIKEQYAIAHYAEHFDVL